MLARYPADPRIEAPASEKPRRDTGCLRDRYDLADNSQVPFGRLVHGLMLPCTAYFGYHVAPALSRPVRGIRPRWSGVEAASRSAVGVADRARGTPGRAVLAVMPM